MTDFLLDPTEREPISKLGRPSLMVQNFGCDIAWETPKGLAGLQRKTIPDLIKSVRSAHLGEQFVKMMESGLSHMFLLIEGTLQWTREGELVGERTSWTFNQHVGVELSAQSKGIMVVHTRNTSETITTVEYLATWTQKAEHVSSLIVRQGPQKNGWGDLSNRDYAIHVMSGFSGIGGELAGQLFDYYGRVPCRHDIVERELKHVPGIGPKRAESIAKVLS